MVRPFSPCSFMNSHVSTVERQFLKHLVSRCSLKLSQAKHGWEKGGDTDNRTN